MSRSLKVPKEEEFYYASILDLLDQEIKALE
jgi:hypothetical protein